MNQHDRAQIKNVTVHITMYTVWDYGGEREQWKLGFALLLKLMLGLKTVEVVMDLIRWFDIEKLVEDAKEGVLNNLSPFKAFGSAKLKVKNVRGDEDKPGCQFATEIDGRIRTGSW